MDNPKTSSPQQPPKHGEPESYDLVILGGGTGSTIAAWTFASEGQRVAAIDRKYIGGSCPNIACLPSKNIIHSAKVASYFRNSKDFGITSSFKIDMSGVRERKRKMVSSLNAMYLDNYAKSGAEFILGTARFIAPKTVQVAQQDGTTRVLRGTNVIVSTGTHATIEAIPGLAETQPLTHIEALELDQIPDHLVVLGGGYIGLELCQAMRRFGSRVTVIERSSRLLPREDEDASATLHEILREEGIEILLHTQITKVSGKSGQSVQVVAKRNGAQKTLEGSHLLVATGRTPNTKDIGLELAGVQLRNDGYIQVNERLQTSAPGVWAIGEVAGSPQFTHVSVDDFRVVHDNIHGGTRVTTGRQVPFCMFSDPEFARIGLSEKEAQAKGLGYRLFKVPMDANLRARTLCETKGFLKALVELDNDRILGFTALGVGGGEVIASVQVAMLAGMPFTALRDAVLTHPTLVEGLTPLFSSAASTHKPSASPQTAAAGQR